MRFGMYGVMSNGNGFCDFYSYDTTKMKNLMKNPAAFQFMNFLIIYLLEESYYTNSSFCDIYLTENSIQRYFHGMKEDKVDEILLYLQSEKLIRVEKKEDQVWIIQYL